MQAAQATLRQSDRVWKALQDFDDASRTGYAEAKVLLLGVVAQLAGCKPHRLLCKAKANVCRKAGNI